MTSSNNSKNRPKESQGKRYKSSPNKSKRKGFKKRFPRFSKALSTLFSKFKETFKKNPVKFAIITALCFGIVYLVATNIFRFPDRIETGNYKHNEAFEDSLIVEGIDVSYAQGDINWKKVKRSGVDFAFIRAGYRDTSKGNLHVDEFFHQNAKKASKAGVMIGLYYFSQATSTKEAIEEANALISLADDYDVPLPLVMDYELNEGSRLNKAISSGKLTSSKLNQIALDFTNVIEEAGYESMIYSNYDFLHNYLDAKWLDDYTNIWGAQYNNEASFSCKYQFWQCSDSFKVPGIEGPVDHNFWYFDKDSGLKSVSGKAAEDRIPISDCEIILKNDEVNYIGFACEPNVKVKRGWRRLWKNRSYITSYVHNTDEGTGYAIVTGKGKYKDMVAIPFKLK